MRSFAPGATPLYLPPDLAPVPETVDATCVPWLCTSFVVVAELKFLDAITWPLRSG